MTQSEVNLAQLKQLAVPPQEMLFSLPYWTYLVPKEIEWKVFDDGAYVRTFRLPVTTLEEAVSIGGRWVTGWWFDQDAVPRSLTKDEWLWALAVETPYNNMNESPSWYGDLDSHGTKETIKWRLIF